jgi:hypothetical protein
MWWSSPTCGGLQFRLAGCSLWLIIATIAELPVSTTQSVVGATVGFSMCMKGFAGIQWSQILRIGVDLLNIRFSLEVFLYYFSDVVVFVPSSVGHYFRCSLFGGRYFGVAEGEWGKSPVQED